MGNPRDDFVKHSQSNNVTAIFNRYSFIYGNLYLKLNLVYVEKSNQPILFGHQRICNN